MPELATLSRLNLCRAEDSFRAAAADFRYAADQLDRAHIALHAGRLSIAEDAVRRYLEGMERGFAAMNDLGTEIETDGPE